ncbi:MAG: methionine--tRNA ligase [Lentisphaerae bacterium]|jgi:methionyl-tRNA synthetase|nr:methionine--tRNA ligase [Lentisphaerota bacterium]
MNESNFYITTPIYYVNDIPHIGHAYTTILADVLAQYQRLLGKKTFFLTGTDEHGQKVQQAAAQKGHTPQEHCDKFVVRFQDLWKRLGITNDDFIRTTQSRHTTIVKKILQDFYDKGLIYSGSYKGWYCVPDERYFTVKDLVDHCCPECHRPVEELEEKSYFFKMGQYQDWLINYIEEHPDFIQPEHRRQETLGFLKNDKLGDLCISRPKKRLAWGIELPFDTDYVTYVWFDALVNYISAVGYLADDEKFNTWWPASYHLIGKDILRTHSVFWPTMLHAMGLPMPKTIFAHGWWLVGDTKMSKSLKNVINPMDMIEKYGVDAFRYFLMAAMNLGLDASFTEKLFVERYNAELANDLGNLSSRVVSMVRRNTNAILPDYQEPGEDEKDLIDATMTAVKEMAAAVESMQIDKGLAFVITAIREGNRYFDKMKPWALAKNGDLKTLGRVLRHTAECLRIVSGLLFPVMPAKMTELRTTLGIPSDDIMPSITRLSSWKGLQDGATIAEAPPLFPRADPIKEEDAQQKAEPKKAAPKNKETQPVNLVTIDQVGQVQLKTAIVIEAVKVPEADKLLKLQLQIGDEKRQIVSGIAEFYTPDQLIGMTIVVIVNLKPAVIRGIESNGMLLAAKKGKTLRLVTTDGEIASGASIG